MACLCRDGFSDLVENQTEVAKHKLVREAQDNEPLAFQPSIALRIAPPPRLGLVRLAVQFDDQACGSAEEIRDVRWDRHLPPELETMEAAATHLLPEGVLGPRVGSSLLAGEGTQARIGFARALVVPRNP